MYESISKYNIYYSINSIEYKVYIVHFLKLNMHRHTYTVRIEITNACFSKYNIYYYISNVNVIESTCQYIVHVFKLNMHKLNTQTI